MSWLADAFKTIESVVLLRSKVEQLTNELARTDARVEKVVEAVLQVDRRLYRLEVLEETRSDIAPLPRIEG